MQSSRTDGEAYTVFTTKFDRVVDARELDVVIGALTAEDQRNLDQAWHEIEFGLLSWRTQLQISSRQYSDQLHNASIGSKPKDAAVTLLFDQSGSMRGQKMLYNAATADVVQEFLVSLGITCEVLGFTTVAWRGGRSRRRWKWRLMPKNPGRLADLLHIVFRDASDKRASTGNDVYRQMLRPDLPKENIDGEAIQWAVARLRNIDCTRKILIVISDGAPVDDSTLRENGPDYLGDHLRSVIESVNLEGEIKLASIGIGYDVASFYSVTRFVEDPSRLGEELLSLVTDSLLAG